LARKNVIFEGYFTEEEKKTLRQMINKNQFDEKTFSTNRLTFKRKTQSTIKELRISKLEKG
jgi:hypothetical protein